MEYTVKVLKSDMETCIYQSSTECPIAKALFRLGLKGVKVGGITFDVEGKTYIIPKPFDNTISEMMNEGRTKEDFEFKFTIKD